MIGTLAAETLALATGIFPKKPPSPADTARATKLHAKVETAIKRFLRGDKPEKWEAWQRPPGQDDLHASIVDVIDADGWFDDHMPIEITPQWLIVVMKARKYLVDKWPTYDDADKLGPANFALSEDEYGNIWELVRTLDGIDNFLADLESYVLTREQVEALKECFPDFFESMDSIILECLTDIQSNGKSLTWQQGDMVRILRNIPDEAPLMTEPAAPEPPKNRQTPPQQNKRIQQLRPTAERIDADQAE